MFSLLGQPTNHSKHLKALARANDDQRMEIALNADDSQLQSAAISTITEPAQLEELSLQLQNKKPQNSHALKLCREQWAKNLLFNENISSFEAEQYVLSCERQDLLAALTGFNENASLSILAFMSITDEAILLNLFETSSPALSLAIIGKLHSQTALDKAKQLYPNDNKISSRINQRIKQLDLSNT